MKKYFKWFVDECHESQRMRLGHGVVDRWYQYNSALTMMVPFNLVARLILSFWYALRGPEVLWWERNKEITRRRATNSASGGQNE